MGVCDNLFQFVYTLVHSITEPLTYGRLRLGVESVAVFVDSFMIVSCGVFCNDMVGLQLGIFGK